jgi:acetyl esterase/lipase
VKPAAALLALVAAACSARRGVEGLVLGGEVVRHADIRYGDSARQRLDVYRRHGPRGPAPVVVFFYGGRWKYGTKDDYFLIGNSFARRGWITVVANYRLYPEVLFPAWVNDGANAVAWTVRNIERFGGDTSRIFVVGHSSGAHTVSLLALDEHYLLEAGVPNGTVRGFASIAGPVDTSWTARDVQRLMGPAEGWPRSYPATHVDGSESPMLLMHGDADDVVSPGSSIRLAERIRARGGCVTLHLYRGVGHVDIAAALGLPSVVSAPVLDDLARFVRDPVGEACPADRGARDFVFSSAI